jgi:hypothetical protein
MRRLLESKRLMEKIKSGEFVSKAEQRRKQMNDAKKVWSSPTVVYMLC